MDSLDGSISSALGIIAASDPDKAKLVLLAKPCLVNHLVPWANLVLWIWAQNKAQIGQLDDCTSTVGPHESTSPKPIRSLNVHSNHTDNTATSVTPSSLADPRNDGSDTSTLPTSDSGTYDNACCTNSVEIHHDEGMGNEQQDASTSSKSRLNQRQKKFLDSSEQMSSLLLDDDIKKIKTFVYEWEAAECRTSLKPNQPAGDYKKLLKQICDSKRDKAIIAVKKMFACMNLYKTLHKNQHLLPDGRCRKGTVDEITRDCRVKERTLRRYLATGHNINLLIQQSSPVFGFLLSKRIIKEMGGKMWNKQQIDKLSMDIKLSGLPGLVKGKAFQHFAAVSTGEELSTISQRLDDILKEIDYNAAQPSYDSNTLSESSILGDLRFDCNSYFNESAAVPDSVNLNNVTDDVVNLDAATITNPVNLNDITDNLVNLDAAFITDPVNLNDITDNLVNLDAIMCGDNLDHLWSPGVTT